MVFHTITIVLQLNVKTNKTYFKGIYFIEYNSNCIDSETDKMAC